MDIRQFSRVNLHKDTPKQSTEPDKTPTTNDTKDYENLINKYKNYDQSSLTSEFLQQADKLKKEGKLNSGYLANLQNTLSPMLSVEQKKMLNDLIEKIKWKSTKLTNL